MRGDVAVLVVAAGMGVRLGPGGPKALRLLGGEPLLVHAVRRAVAMSDLGCVVVAAPPGAVELVRDMVHRVTAGLGAAHVVAGGADRQASVAAALAVVPDACDIVLVHDAARSLTPPHLFERVAQAVRSGHDAVIPVLPVVDTIKEVDSGDRVLGTVDRSVLRSVQTPQGFRRSVLLAAHAAASGNGASHTDDAGLAEKIGVSVQTVPGEAAALKVTTPFDLAIAELLLAGEAAS